MSDIIVLSSGRRHRFSTSFNSAPFVELLAGETLHLFGDGMPITSVTTVAGTVTIDAERAVTSETPGRIHLRVQTSDGIDTDVSIICCEPACLARLPDVQRSGEDLVNKRRVLRELARYDQTFTGTAAELANKPLALYGGA